MRVWMILLLTVTTASALGLGIWYMGNRNQIEVEPAIELPIPDELVEILYGASGDLEILLRPFYGDSVEDQFHDEQLNRILAPQERQYFGRIWIVNHGKANLPFDAKLESTLEFTDEEGATRRSTSLLALVENKGGVENLTASTAMILKALGSFDRTTLSTNEFVDLTIAMPFNFGSLMPSGAKSPHHSISLVPANARRADLRTFVSAPQGRMSNLLIRSSDADAEKEQASRK